MQASGTMVVDEALIAFCAITLTAVIYSTLSTHLVKVWGNRTRVKQIQEEMGRVNKLVEAATKSGDAGKKKEADEAQGKLPSLLKESMVLQFKPILVTLPIFAIATWALKGLFPNFKITLGWGVYLPIFIQNLERFPNWRNEFGVVGWFVLSLFLAGMLLQAIVGKIEAWRKKQAKQQ